MNTSRNRIPSIADRAVALMAFAAAYGSDDSIVDSRVAD